MDFRRIGVERAGRVKGFWPIIGRERIAGDVAKDRVDGSDPRQGVERVASDPRTLAGFALGRRGEAGWVAADPPNWQ
jgi:hypothetical protein